MYFATLNFNKIELTLQCSYYILLSRSHHKTSPLKQNCHVSLHFVNFLCEITKNYINLLPEITKTNQQQLIHLLRLHHKQPAKSPYLSPHCTSRSLSLSMHVLLQMEKWNHNSNIQIYPSVNLTKLLIIKMHKGRQFTNNSFTNNIMWTDLQNSAK